MPPRLSTESATDFLDHDIFGDAKAIGENGQLIEIEEAEKQKQTSPTTYWQARDSTLQLLMAVCMLILFVLFISVIFG